MGVRAIIFLGLLAVAPSFAQALDIFEFYENVLKGRKPVQQQTHQISEPQEEDWTNAIVIDLNPKPQPQPQPLPSRPAQTYPVPIPVPGPQSPQQLPPPLPVPQVPQQLPPPVKPVPAPLPAPVPTPLPPSPQQPQGRFEVKKPDVYREKVETKRSETEIREWKDDKRAHWEFELQKYYARYTGGEASMNRMEKFTKDFENSVYYDPSKARGLDPNKYGLPLNGVNGGKFINNTYTRRWTTYNLILCPITKSVGKAMSPQGQLDAKAWNNSFGNLADGGQGIVRQFNNQADFDAGFAALCQQSGVQNCNDEFKNAVKSSAAKWDEQAKSEVVEEKYEVRGKNKVKWRIEPLIYFNLDIEQKIVNLTPYVNDPDNQPPIPYARNIVGGEQRPSPMPRIPLRPALPGYGYDVSRKQTLGIGGGVGIQSIIDWSSPSWAWLKQAGVFAGGMITANEVKGSTKRIEPNDEQLRDMMAKVTGARMISHNSNRADETVYTAQDIYPNLDNIRRWKVGESYLYTLRGGFMLTGGIHWMAIAMGPTFVKEGSAETIVTKIGDDKVMVELTSLDVYSGAMSLAAGIVSYSQVYKNTIDKVKKTYFYDLGMEAGRRAFLQLMIGNIYDTECLIAQDQTVAVAIVERDVSRTYLDRKAGDFMSSWYIGIPFIYWNLLKGKTTEEGLQTDFVDNLENRYFHGMYFENKNRRIIFDHKYVTSAFYSGIENTALRPAKRTDYQDFYGRYFWNFQDESADRSTLRKQLNKMIYFMTGLEELEVDESAIRKDDIGYVNAEVIVDLNQEATLALMMNAVEGDGPDIIAGFEKGLADFLKTDYPESLDYCNKPIEMNQYRNLLNENHDHFHNKKKAKEDCVEFIREKFTPVIKNMINELKNKMWKYANSPENEDKRLFAQSYAEFGRLMMTNRFTFRAIYNFLTGIGIGDFVRYTINGESLANMVIYFPSGKVGRPVNLINQ